MNILIIVFFAWVVGVCTPLVLRGVCNRLLGLSVRVRSLGWIWVILGPGGMQVVHKRFQMWSKGKKRCTKCGARVNTLTQVGVAVGSDGSSLFCWCPKCTKARKGGCNESPAKNYL